MSQRQRVSCVWLKAWLVSEQVSATKTVQGPQQVSVDRMAILGQGVSGAVVAGDDVVSACVCGEGVAASVGESGDGGGAGCVRVHSAPCFDDDVCYEADAENDRGGRVCAESESYVVVARVEVVVGTGRLTARWPASAFCSCAWLMRSWRTCRSWTQR